MMVVPTVVFDLDGTLVDSAPDLADTLNIIFAREGLPPVAYDTARKLVGGGARSMIERSLAAQGRKLDTPAVDGLVKGFIDHYAAHIADGPRGGSSCRCRRLRLRRNPGERIGARSGHQRPRRATERGIRPAARGEPYCGRTTLIVFYLIGATLRGPLAG